MWFEVRGGGWDGGGDGRRVQGEGWGRERAARDIVFPLAAEMETALSRRMVKEQKKVWNLNGIFGISTKNLTIYSRNADDGGKYIIP